MVPAIDQIRGFARRPKTGDELAVGTAFERWREQMRLIRLRQRRRETGTRRLTTKLPGSVCPNRTLAR